MPSVHKTQNILSSGVLSDLLGDICMLSYPEMPSLDEELRHLHPLAVHPLSDLVLEGAVHEDVPLLELHHQRLQDLAHLPAPLRSSAHDAHRRRVEHDAAGLFLVVIALKKNNIYIPAFSL